MQLPATLLISVLILFTSVKKSQSSFEGDDLIKFLGKEANSAEIKSLKAAYNFEMANEAHYLSNAGVELIFRGNTLVEIHLYKASAVYGNYTGKMPKNLKFGLGSSDARRLLGKPSISYSSGYCEYEFKDYTLSCWFDGGRLTQVGLAMKYL